ncbi:MAG: ATP-dependent DNA helicase [Desulfomonile tiedjei]|uniref:ATP-dependent DNA helicase n=1 Tax=Desulfomonile tiedjei TaxID=2358 RepID=A0A9D6V800_9BACT|nr:ATP-dependent DNA helicase [Desulfomonile tiedjei]
MESRNQIKSILGSDGILARSMDGYEYREQQVQMALGVFDALESDDRLIVEAPTGTGKTLAYLVAAALSRKRVAISTGTKNLQEQLFFKDIPFLRERLFPSLKAALLKGRGNFVCHSRLMKYLRQPHLEGIAADAWLKEILAWYRKTREKGEGDRSEIENLPDDDPVWPEICSTTESCLGKKCPDRDDCFVMKMKSKAFDADLMVVNHHLLTSDLAVKESGFGEVIPRYEALIVDEAHGLEDAATQHFGFHISLFRITRLVRDIRAELSEARVDLEKLRKNLTDVEDDSRRLFTRFADFYGMRSRLEPVHGELAEIRDRVCLDLESLGQRVTNIPQASEELRNLGRRASGISIEIQTVLPSEPGSDYACWAERRDRSVILHASPVEVGDKLQSALYEKTPSIVFTSATLSSGGNFDYFKSRLGLNGDPAPEEILLDSPFDYSSQTLLYIPKTMPEPNSPEFANALSGKVSEILQMTRGRAFVLFTSYKNMDEVYRQVQGKLSFPMLIQGAKPKSKLLEEFRSKTGAVLFATSSFWEGVDVQGEALSCVIVDRLPFAPPDDPVVSARLEKLKNQGKDPFYSFQVPMAVIALKQGLGRLIRTRSDKGVLCILDIRILTKQYGKIFRKSLHQSPLHRDVSALGAFFAE